MGDMQIEMVPTPAGPVPVPIAPQPVEDQLFDTDKRGQDQLFDTDKRRQSQASPGIGSALSNLFGHLF